MKFTYPTPKGMDIELAFETQVLKLKSLHYGLWDDHEELTIDNLRKAQTRYTQNLLRFIPKDVETILDVGAGIGDNATRLSEEGYKVTAISPDPNHKIAFEEITKKHSTVNFVLSKYEDFKADQKFDLVLMSESSNYFSAIEGLNQTAKYLHQRGYLLVSGLFRRHNSEEYEAMNIYGEYVNLARKIGFELVHEEDITERVLPSLALGNKLYSDYAIPSINILSDFYQNAFPLKAKILSLFFREELRLLSDAFLKAIPERLDTKKFEKFVVYKIVLFKKC